MNFIKKNFLLAAFIVPFGPTDGWKQLTFSKIKPNKVSFGKTLKLEINNSASPLILSTKKSSSVKTVKVKAMVEGNISIPAGSKQGQTKKPKADDYVFRLGLVLAGDTFASKAKLFFAPKWVKEMFKLAPKGKGLKHIHFLNVSENSSDVGQKRTHPLSSYLYEEVVAHRPDGTIEFTKTFDTPVDVLGLWISADGDDTRSSFKINIKEIVLD